MGVTSRIKYNHLVRYANHLRLKERNKTRILGNLKATALKILAENLSKDENSLTYNFDQEMHKIETVLLKAANTKKNKDNYTVLFYEKKFVINFTEVTRIYLDGTYRARPKRHILGLSRSSQFLTIMAEINGKVIYCYWFFL